MTFEEYWGNASTTFKKFAGEIWRDAQKEQRKNDANLCVEFEGFFTVRKITEAILNQSEDKNDKA